jgi:hypothetical protein
VIQNLWVASTRSQTVKPQIRIKLVKVPTTSALWYPNDRVLSDFLCAKSSEAMEIANPTRSEAKWAESVKIAIEFARIPP